MMQDKNEFANTFNMKINLGLLAVSFAVILSLLQIEKLDGELVLALCCFTFILPISIYGGFLYQLVLERPTNDARRTLVSDHAVDVLTLVAIFIAILGMMGLLSHFSVDIFYVLAVSAVLVGVIFFFTTRKRSEKIKKTDSVIAENQPAESEFVVMPEKKKKQGKKAKKNNLVA
jgi:hypothetical protein